MPIDISPYLEDGSLTTLHWEFGRMLARRGGVPEDAAPTVALLGAKCLQAVENGHSCLGLDDWENAAPGEERPSDKSPLAAQEWEALLDACPQLLAVTPGECKPFYYDRVHRLLYLQKYFLAENNIADFIRGHLGTTVDVVLDGALKDEIHALSRLFEGKSFDEDLQQQAVAMALTHRFSILTGGPGTGKTTTLASILVMERRKRPDGSIALAAPTGKAARQMKESLDSELLNNLYPEQVDDGIRNALQAIPATTLHRLLGMVGDGSAPFYKHENPLTYSLVVVDESSMVSLRMLEQLLDALAPDCRLLLIGDQNQLPSVEAGSVLGDFCSRCARLNPPNPLESPAHGYVTRFVENHRLQKDNLPLKKFLEAMAGNADAAGMKPQIDDLYGSGQPLFKASELMLTGTARERREALKGHLERTVDDMLASLALPPRFSYYFGDEATRDIRFSLDHWRGLKRRPGDDLLKENASQLPLALCWHYLESFRIICAVHDGLWGEKSFNALMAEVLDKQKGDNGTPVIVLRNDSETQLSNGDVGIFWNRRVYFPRWKRVGTDHEIFDIGRCFLPHQLPENTLAFAMTIHKSQGSGYDNVLMALPEEDSRVISRELIYTGFSRTKRRFQLWGPRALLDAAIDRPTCRWSGLPFML